MNILELLDLILGNKLLLFISTALSIFIKAIILGILLFKNHKATKLPKLLLMTLLLCSMIVDSAWIIYLIYFFLFNDDIGMFRAFWVRLSWGFNALLYMSLSLFLDTLMQQKRLNLLQYFTIGVYSIFFLFFSGIALMHIHRYKVTDRAALEFLMQHTFKVTSIILLFANTCLSIFKMQRSEFPRILKKQLKIFIYWIILPFCFSELTQFWPIVLAPGSVTNSYTGVSFSTLLMTFGIYFATRKFIGLRFLNFRGHVESKSRFNFIDGFKDILEQLSHATSIKELQHLTQISFKDMFNIPISRIRLYVRLISNLSPEQKRDISHAENTIENFLLMQSNLVYEYIKRNHIFIYDEIAFSNFYEKSEQSQKILAFLDSINADIFIPIHTKKKIIAFIVIDRFARPNEFYSNVEHDEMAVFASYLANIINLLQTRNLEQIIHNEKELHEELYNKHQEINQYKESIRSFLRNTRQKEIGIIFYKNRRFTFGNQAAKELINININQQEGHPITQKIKGLARRVQEYKSPQSCFVKDKDGNKLVLSAVQHLEQNNVIISVYYPEVSDLVKKQIEALKDPTKWDYLLYLETTESGKLINQLIPSSGEHLLNFKISLLQAALSKKATLLEMPEADLLPTVKLLHHISLRETLHILKLTYQSTNSDIATKLFGINPIFGHQTEKPLLEKLDNNGTLFIQNIHFLDLETQEYLAEYIMYGMYRVFKSDQKVASNARIICSTNKNLHILVQEGTFSKQLFNQLKRHILSMPSLLTVSEHEIHELAEGYTEQAIKADDFKNLLELTEKEKHKLVTQRPISLQELKNKIQQILFHKSKRNEIYNETQFDPAYEINDPELTEAARLGKHALRDEKIMTLLWNKFHSQSKIASFLGVNRSSVNRRCKQYNLQ